GVHRDGHDRELQELRFQDVEASADLVVDGLEGHEADRNGGEKAVPDHVVNGAREAVGLSRRELGRRLEHAALHADRHALRDREAAVVVAEEDHRVALVVAELDALRLHRVALAVDGGRADREAELALAGRLELGKEKAIDAGAGRVLRLRALLHGLTYVALLIRRESSPRGAGP